LVRLLGLRAGCPVQRQARYQGAVLGDVAGDEEGIQQCLQRVDILARDWLQLGLLEVDRFHGYEDLRHDLDAPFICRPSAVAAAIRIKPKSATQFPGSGTTGGPFASALNKMAQKAAASCAAVHTYKIIEVAYRQMAGR